MNKFEESPVITTIYHQQGCRDRRVPKVLCPQGGGRSKGLGAGVGDKDLERPRGPMSGQGGHVQ